MTRELILAVALTGLATSAPAAVGHQGGAATSGLAPAQEPSVVEGVLALDRPARRLIQQGLRNEGFDPGAPDGLFGPRTRAAIRRWQEAQGVLPSGYLDRLQAERLHAAGAPRPVGSDNAPLAAPVVADASVAESRSTPEPICDGSRAGLACWVTLENQPECYVRNESFTPDTTATWTGTCVDGFAQGAGSLTWTEDDEQSVHSGFLEAGRKHGHWVEASVDTQNRPLVDS